MSVEQLVAIAGLGAFHGLNPAMGWLFAVALGLQQGSRRAVYGAIGPIAAGHAAAIALAVAVLVGLREVVSIETLRIAGSVALAAFAIWKLLVNRHLRWVGFRLGWGELTLWSFLMASAHGAGLMLLPLVLGMQADTSQLGMQTVDAGLLAVAVHTLAMLAVAGALAVAVYEYAGLGILRSGWLNVDRLWAGALLVGATATLFG